MPRSRVTALRTQVGRSKLKPDNAPYWISISRTGLLGYATRKRTWLFRFVDKSGRHRSRAIGLGRADDDKKADGKSVLSFRQAVRLARQCCQEGRHRSSRQRHLYRVADAAKDYTQDYIRAGHYHMSDGRSAKIGVQGIAEFHIIPLLGHIPVARLTRTEIQRWLFSIIDHRARQQHHYHGGPQFYSHVPLTEEERRQRRQTANRVLCVLKAILNYAVREGHVKCDPSAWREIRYFPYTKVGPRKFMSSEEQRMLVAACEGDFRHLVMGALYTGARFAELAQLQVRNLLGNSIYLPPLITKTRKERRICLDRSAHSFFEALVRGRPPEDLMFTYKGYSWRVNDEWRCMRSAALKAQLTHFIFRDFRNAAAANWVRAGVPLKYIADQLGNSLRICELHYAHISPDHRSEVFSKLANCIEGMEDFPNRPAAQFRVRQSVGQRRI